MSDDMHEPGPLVLLTRLSRLVYKSTTDVTPDLKVREVVTLNHLRVNGETPQSELAHSLCIDANNLVILLNCLEEAGHVERKRDPQDRRRHIVSITEAGSDACRQAERQIDSVTDEVLSSLSTSERGQLRELLHKALGDRDRAQTDSLGLDRAEDGQSARLKTSA